MAGPVVASVGLMRVPEARMCAGFLGMAVVVMVIAADSPVSAGSPDVTPQSVGFLTDVPSSPESPPSGLEGPDPPGVPPSSSKPRLTGAHVASESPVPEAAHPVPLPPPGPSEPLWGPGPDFEALAKLPTVWKPTGTTSDRQSSPSTPPRPQPQWSTSIAWLRPSASAGPPSSQPGLDPSSTRRDGASPLPAPPPQTLQPSLTDRSHSSVLDVDWLSPSRAPLQESQPAHDANAPAHPDQTLTPGYTPPPAAPLHASPLPGPAEHLYPTRTTEPDWGSGDYFETMSFLNPEGEDYYLVTRAPSDWYDVDDHTESYDTSFPSREGLSPSSSRPPRVSPSPSLTAAHASAVHDPPPTAAGDDPDTTDAGWPDAFAAGPTSVLLPDMNSLEYHTAQLSGRSRSQLRGTAASTAAASTAATASAAADIKPTSSFTSDAGVAEEASSGELSGFQPRHESAMATTEESHLDSEPPDPSVTPALSSGPSPSWAGHAPTTGLPAATLTFGIYPTSTQPSATPLLPDDDVDEVSSSSMTDVRWFVTEATIHATPTAASAFPPAPTDPAASLSTTEPTSDATELLPGVMADQTAMGDGAGVPATMSLIPTSSGDGRVPAEHAVTAASAPGQAAAGTGATADASASVTVISTGSRAAGSAATTPRPFLCSLDRSQDLVTLSFPAGVTAGFAKSQVRDALKGEFNQSVELQVVAPPPKFVFRAVSGQVVYTAISVVSALRRTGRRFLSASPSWVPPEREHQVHTVLQFVPRHVDVRFCSFSESVERGLTLAFAEVCRRSKESTNFTVLIVNITTATPKHQEQRLARHPVDITFSVRGSGGYLLGSEVSSALMRLTVVEFSYYMGFPVLQIAEPFHYPELNTSQMLRSSWLRTVLLGVLDQKVGERTFQASMERRVAMLLGEAMGSVRRVKRATAVGNSSVQVVSVSRLEGVDHPLEMVYFVEDPSGQRMPAGQAANLLNGMDVQRAAIILGYRVQGTLAQPVEKVPSSPSDAENSNVWIVVGVVIPLLVVVVIISVLYRKLCRTDKLEFQPDAVTSIQQRQKLQAPSVKGFDFAKLHLGQQSKDDVTVVQESVPPGHGPGPPPASAKGGLSPSENGDIPTPIPKRLAAPTKASCSARRRISPSDGDSVVSDRSSQRDLAEEKPRAHAMPSDSRPSRKAPINASNGPPPANSSGELLSSASIFDHVDRMSRNADAGRRLPGKVQLIAMQPMAVPPVHGPPAAGRPPDTQIQVALRHKSEIEHHRNKIRLRAKRKGHYDFPAMDDIAGALAETKDQDRLYQKAQAQISKILDPDAQMAAIFMGPKKSGRGRRSPRQRVKQLNGGVMEADRDYLIAEDGDAYRKCPGVNNVAYVSDLDQRQGSPRRSPSPTDDVFSGPSPPGQAPPPPPYVPPQPSIEEARQQMRSLLDDAFALVSPSSQGSAGVTLPGVSASLAARSPPGRGPRPWGPAHPALSPHPARLSELGVSPAPGLIPRQGPPPGEPSGQCEHLQPDSLYSSKVLYTGDFSASARPRPVGGAAGAQLHHLAQVGLSNRMNGYPAGVRTSLGPNGVPGWNHYHEENLSRAEAENDAMTRCSNRESSAPPVHLDPPEAGYLPAPPPPDTAPPTHSSASLIKAIREELLRLTQKQAAPPSYRS